MAKADSDLSWLVFARLMELPLISCMASDHVSEVSPTRKLLDEGLLVASTHCVAASCLSPLDICGKWHFTKARATIDIRN